MALRIPWDKYETALLIEACVSAMNHEVSWKGAIKSISNTLRQRAVDSGAQFDEIYRNENGISFQLGIIKSLMEGEAPEKYHTSKVFCDMVKTYYSDRELFEAILKEAKLDSSKVKSDNKKKSSNKERFIQWLLGKFARPLANEYLLALKSVETFAKNDRLCGGNLSIYLSTYPSIYDVVDPSVTERILKALDIGYVRIFFGPQKFPEILKATRLFHEYTSERYGMIDSSREGPAIAKKVNDTQSPSVLSSLTFDDEVEPFVLGDVRDVDFSNTTLISVSYFGDEYPVSCWEELYIQVLKLLYEDYPRIFKKLRDQEPVSPIFNERGARFLKKPECFANGFYVETKLSALSIVRAIRKLMDDCNVEYENLEILCCRTLPSKDVKTEKPEKVERKPERPLKQDNTYVPVEEDPIISYLNQERISYVDHRKNRGRLWIIGGRDVADVINQLRSSGVALQFVVGGCRATNGKDAWWTTDSPKKLNLPTKPSEKTASELQTNEDEQYFGSFGELFVEWCLDRGLSQKDIDKYLSLLRVVDKFALESRLSEDSILDLDNCRVLEGIRNKLSCYDGFREFDCRNGSCLSDALRIYLDFLSYFQGNDSIGEEDILIKETSPFREGFANYMRQNNLAERTVVAYLSSLKWVDQYILEHGYSKVPLFEISDFKDVKSVWDQLCNDMFFLDFNREKHNNFSAPMNQYVSYRENVQRNDVCFEETTRSKLKESENNRERAEQEESCVVNFAVDKDFTFTKPISVSYFGKVRFATEWTKIYVEFFDMLYRDYSTVLKGLRDQNDKPVVCNVRESESLFKPEEFTNGYYIDVHGSASRLVDKIKRLLDACNVDYENLEIRYKKVEPKVKRSTVTELLHGSSKEKDNLSIDPLIAYLKMEGLSYIDYRGNKGCLWVVGGSEIKDKINYLSSCGVRFHFCVGGSNATKKQSAWWTKDAPSELKRQMSLFDSLESEKENDVNNQNVQQTFVEWMGRHSVIQSTIKRYVTALNDLDDYVLGKHFIECSLWNVKNVEILKTVHDKLYSDSYFLNYNRRTHHNCSSAFNYYIEFRKSEVGNDSIPKRLLEGQVGFQSDLLPQDKARTESSDDSKTGEEKPTIAKDWIRFNFSNAQSFERTWPAYCSVNGEEIQGRNWARILVRIVEREIATQNPLLAKLYERPLLHNTRTKRPFFIKNDIVGLNCAQLSNGDWICVNASIPRLMEMIKGFCRFCRYKKSQIVIYGVPKGSAHANVDVIPTRRNDDFVFNMAKAEAVLKKTGLKGVAIQELIDAVQPGAAVFPTKCALEANLNVIAMPSDNYVHSDCFVDLADAEEGFERILKGHFVQFDGYSNKYLLYGAASQELSLFLNDNDCDDIDSVYAIARYLFEKKAVAGKRYKFHNPHIFEVEPDFPMSLKGLMVRLAKSNAGVLYESVANEYIQKIKLTFSSMKNLLQIGSSDTFLTYDDRRYLLSEKIGIDKSWLCQMHNKMDDLFRQANVAYVIPRDINDSWIGKLPSLPQNLPWTRLLLQEVLDIYHEIGFKSISADVGQSHRTLAAAFVPSESPLQTFSDVVTLFMEGKHKLPLRMSGEELRAELRDAGMLENNELMTALPKALNDYRFAWTDNNKNVLVRGNR